MYAKVMASTHNIPTIDTGGTISNVACHREVFLPLRLRQRVSLALPAPITGAGIRVAVYLVIPLMTMSRSLGATKVTAGTRLSTSAYPILITHLTAIPLYTSHLVPLAPLLTQLKLGMVVMTVAITTVGTATAAAIAATETTMATAAVAMATAPAAAMAATGTTMATATAAVVAMATTAAAMAATGTTVVTMATATETMPIKAGKAVEHSSPSSSDLVDAGRIYEA
jgi:hypothetical protein